MNKICIIFFCLSVFCLACSNTTQNNAAATAGNAKVDSINVDTAQVEELPLPTVPATLREPAARAAYVIQHFWDAMDFADTLHSHNSAFMEQNFANFISVFPYAGEQACREAVSTLFAKAASDIEAYKLLSTIAEDYLYDPNSPMLNEDIYILFLEQMIDAPALGVARTVRLKHQLRMAKLNRVGMKAADFAYLTRDGKRARLHGTEVKDKMLLLFYDPDCDHCKEIMAKLKTQPLLEDLVANGRLSVLAIYAGWDSKLWKSTYKELPAGWIVGMNDGDIYEKELYALRAMPVMYLLDTNKTVLVKDISYERLVDYLSAYASGVDLDDNR